MEEREEEEAPEPSDLLQKKPAVHSGSARRLAFLGLLAMALLVGVVAFVVANAFRPDEEDVGEETQPVKGQPPSPSPRANVSTTTAPSPTPSTTLTSTVSEWTTKMTTTPKPEKTELQHIMCVMGVHSSPDIYYLDSPCDYLVYSDIVPLQTGILGKYDNDGWEKFKMITSHALKREAGFPTSKYTGSRIHFGASFSIDDIDTLLPSLHAPAVMTEMRTLFQKNLMAAYGIFGSSGTLSSTLTDWAIHFQNLYKFLRKTLRGYSPYNVPLTTLFLGVRLHDLGAPDRDAFHSLVFAINHIIDILVIETHVTDPPVPSTADCIIYPVSAWNESLFMNSSYPALRLAGALMVLAPLSYVTYSFSFTMGVMQFMKPGSKSMLKFRDKCSSRYLVHYDVVCDKMPEYDNSSAMAYGDDPRSHDTLYAFENNETISDKVTVLKRISDAVYTGFVAFDMQMDTYQCSFPTSMVHTFERIAKLRDLVVPDER